MPGSNDADEANGALHRQRQTLRKWGLFVLIAALIIGAIVAPHTTLLVFVLLIGLGALGLAIAWALRQMERLFQRPGN